MATDVVMPQMGESIAEGTIVRWLKQVGDAVERDEPLFEISTDKVDAEIPSPAAGVLAEIRAKEGETVAVNAVVAVIQAAGAAVVPAPPKAAAAPGPPAPAQAAAPAAAPPSAPAPSVPPPAAPVGTSGLDQDADVVRQRSSPLVRRMAKEHDIDISAIQGTGLDGRVTKHDVQAFLDQKGARATTPPAAAAPSPVVPKPTSSSSAPAAPGGPGLAGRTVPMSVMRKKIAEHMVMSRRTSAHVHTVFEVDFQRLAQIREGKKAEYEKAGAKLTYMAFILKAVVEALRAVPIVNASVDGDNIVYHQDVNVGIAVALDWGLIVPVVKRADEKNLLGLSRAVADLAARARSKQLKPDEVSGGTFTITNPGVFGAQFGMPIISQPQVAILGVGHIEKRAVVVDDAIAIRPRAYLTLGYDHRLIDGAVADEFMSHIKRALEHWDASEA